MADDEGCTCAEVAGQFVTSAPQLVMVATRVLVTVLPVDADGDPETGEFGVELAGV